MFPPLWRQSSLALTEDQLDLVVVGGGITGVGVLLDAVQRGMRAVLIEKGDIASGTSSRSSKLIHGGLRYLKRMHLGMTRQSSHERDRMLALSPHLVTPLRFVYPVSRHDRTPSWQVGLGLWLYERLRTHEQRSPVELSAAELRGLAPELDASDLDRAFTYTDGLMDDARLTLAVAATAHAYGAGIVTRAELMHLWPGRHEALADHPAELAFLDHESGQTRRTRAHAVVIAAGVWTDVLRDRLQLTSRRMRPSRGAHLVLPPERYRLRAAVTIPSPDDSRPVFFVPHPEGLLVGTTDLYHDGAVEDPRATSDEIAYLLRAVAAAFPGVPASRETLRGAYAGLRPILNSYADSHADTPSDASREEDVWEEQGALFVAGGKLTTWRATAEHVVNEVARRLPEERRQTLSACFTAGTPLVGLTPGDAAVRLHAALGLSSAVAEGMVRRLAGLASSAAASAHDVKELAPLLDSDVCAAEVRAHLRWGAVLHLDDLIIRRLRIGQWNPASVPRLLPLLRPLLVDELGWDNTRLTREEERLMTLLEGYRA